MDRAEGLRKMEKSNMNNLRFTRISGAVVGAWLAVIYALVSVEINRSSLPGIPLPEPSGGIFGFYLSYLGAGAALGLIACWTDNKWAGVVTGAAIGAVILFFLPWKNALGSSTLVLGAIFLTLTTFLPLLIIILPVTLVVRQTAESLPTRLEGSLSLDHLRWPIGATILAIVLGSFSLYPPEVQDGFNATQRLVKNGLKATSPAELPAPLKDVENWFPNANGKYTLEWSEDTDRYMGPVPVTTFLHSDYLIVVRFSNKFTVACIFSPGVKTPSCANFE
jgi:hypothetical protein